MDGQPLQAAVPCQLCCGAGGLLPHRNCANLDCNRLFIACSDCAVSLGYTYSTSGSRGPEMLHSGCWDEDISGPYTLHSVMCFPVV